MTQVINTNIMSLTAQNNLNKSQSSLATAMERLSSGLRINSSADDAAGYAISTRMTTQINGLDTAARNANDAVSLAQTASAALQQVTDNLQTIRQLAVQAANATNSQSDRDALDSEVQQRLAEITRVSQQTTFNGRRILDGSFGTAAFQVGANVGETISINLSQGTEASQIGKVATVSDNVSGSFGGLGVAAGDLTVTIGGGSAVNVSGHFSSASGLVAAINTAATAAGATGAIAATSGNEIKITALASGVTFGGADASTLGLANEAAGASGTSTGVNAAVTATSGASVTLAAGDLTINGTAVTGTFDSAQALADGINAAGIQGVSSYLDDSGKLVIQTNGTADDNGSTAGGVDGITIAGSGIAGIASGTTTASGSLAKADSSNDEVNVKTVAAANDTINRIDSALASVSSIDSQLGAMQNRFNSAISDAQAVSQNLSSSRSRIEDADFASETAAMSKAQILQQAGISMLAQANAAPQLVLKLLQ
ncbi:MAG: flagellin [Rhodanobacteraceae bacterium]